MGYFSVYEHALNVCISYCKSVIVCVLRITERPESLAQSTSQLEVFMCINMKDEEMRHIDKTRLSFNRRRTTRECVYLVTLVNPVFTARQLC